MKNIMITFILFISSVAFAGNGGGTMMAVSQDALMKLLISKITLKTIENKQIKQIVFDMGSTNQKLQFAHGKFDGEQWLINKVEINGSDIQSSTLEDALSQSIQSNNWVEIKN
jgi:hypothetical protein